MEGVTFFAEDVHEGAHQKVPMPFIENVEIFKDCIELSVNLPSCG